MITDSLDHRVGTAVADTESFGSDTAEIGFTTNGAIQHHITDQDVLLRLEGAVLWRVDDDLAAGQALADKVIGVAFDPDGNAAGQPCAEALAGTAGQLHIDGVFRQ